MNSELIVIHFWHFLCFLRPWKFFLMNLDISTVPEMFLRSTTNTGSSIWESSPAISSRVSPLEDALGACETVRELHCGVPVTSSPLCDGKFLSMLSSSKLEWMSIETFLGWILVYIIVRAQFIVEVSHMTGGHLHSYIYFLTLSVSGYNVNISISSAWGLMFSRSIPWVPTYSTFASHLYILMHGSTAVSLVVVIVLRVVETKSPLRCPGWRIHQSSMALHRRKSQGHYRDQGNYSLHDGNQATDW